MQPTSSATARQQQVRLEQEERQQEDLSEHHTFHPEINRNILVESSGDLIERLQKWDDLKHKKREDKIREKEEAEMTYYKGAPLIDEHSARMAERISGRTNQSVSDRLYADAERERYHRAVLQEKSLLENVPGAPAITKQAAQLLRGGEVTDRLYDQAVELAKKRQKAIEEHAQKQLADTRGVHIPSHSQSLHQTGGVGGHGGGAGGVGSIERGEALYRRAEQERERREQEAKRRETDTLQEMKPRINKRSKEIGG